MLQNSGLRLELHSFSTNLWEASKPAVGERGGKLVEVTFSALFLCSSSSTKLFVASDFSRDWAAGVWSFWYCSWWCGGRFVLVEARLLPDHHCHAWQLFKADSFLSWFWRPSCHWGFLPWNSVWKLRDGIVFQGNKKRNTNLCLELEKFSLEPARKAGQWKVQFLTTWISCSKDQNL